MHLLKLLRILGSEIVRQTEIAPCVVQLPHVFLKRPPRFEFPRGPMNSTSEPAVLVDSAVAEDLKVLRGVPTRSLGIREGVDHAHTLDGCLDRSVDALWLR